MQPGSQWCPLCSLPKGEVRDEKSLCPRCGGSGSVHCSQCLCLECGGTGQVACQGCRNGRVPCATCRGEARGGSKLLGTRCRSCDGTGIVYHEECLGRGAFPCQACLGIGHLPECKSCNGSGESPCPVCFATGLSPSTHLLSAAEGGAIAHLLNKLPVTTDDKGGDLVDLPGAVQRATAFLAIYHWTPAEPESEREHQLFVLRDRLHLQVALLEMDSRRSVRIQYHFLTVARSGETTFRVRYSQQQKAWR